MLEIGPGATLCGLPDRSDLHVGVPEGGAFDDELFAYANAIFMNPKGALVAELAVYGGRFQATTAAQIGLVSLGADIMINEKEQPSGILFNLKEGDVVTVGRIHHGCRAYLSVSGGFLGNPRPVNRGEVLEFQSSKNVQMRSGFRLTDQGEKKLRIIAGPDYAILPELHRDIDLTVSPQLNRVGVRLLGAPQITIPELTSSPAAVGTVQVTASGEWIIIGPEGPTIGGYPKIGMVCRADQKRVSRLQASDHVGLEWIDAETAKICHQREASRINRILEIIRSGIS